MPVNDLDICSHGRPNHQDLIAELREVAGLPGPPLPITPEQAWNEAIVALRAALAARPQPLITIAERILAWSSNERNDFFRVGFMVCGIEDELRAALAARPQPLFEGAAKDAWEWLGDQAESTWATRQVAVYPAVAGSATPTGDDDD